MITFNYVTYFYLSNAVSDVDEANGYLHSEDMTGYLRSELLQKDVTQSVVESVECIRWDLDSNGYQGRVVAQTSQELPESALKLVSKWIHEQNADGIGEGFEQQDFAHYLDKSVNYGIGGGDDCDEDD